MLKQRAALLRFNIGVKEVLEMNRSLWQKKIQAFRVAGAFLIVFGVCAAVYAGIGVGQCIYQSVKAKSGAQSAVFLQVESERADRIPSSAERRETAVKPGGFPAASAAGKSEDVWLNSVNSAKGLSTSLAGYTRWSQL